MVENVRTFVVVKELRDRHDAIAATGFRLDGSERGLERRELGDLLGRAAARGDVAGDPAQYRGGGGEERLLLRLRVGRS